ncbi:MAG: sulfotransferase family protein [Thioploca sp.]|nr:sulfotransferase family protein [Thioploca sp.]
MFISHKYRLIFVHIQRTGGNSIYQEFARYDLYLQNKLPFKADFKRFKHPYAIDIKQVLAAEIFDNYIKFAVVRNPFDRLVSWYSMFKHKTIDKTLIPREQYPEMANMGEAVEEAFEHYVKSFEDFIKLSPYQANGLFTRFHTPQRAFVCDEEGRLLVNKILRFETLSTDFLTLAKEISFEGHLSQVNASIREQNYRSYYNEDLKKQVTDRFKVDLDYFGYDF